MGKKLGQHFLRSKRTAGEIVSAGDVRSGDLVLEIGPGRGVLTEKLLASGAKVVAIEKDFGLVAGLEERFSEEIVSGRLRIVSGDALSFPPSEEFGNKTYKLIANIPYYITGALLRHFLSSENKPASIVFLVQKEVAERIVAKDGKESVLSISVKAYGKPKYIKTVKRDLFGPPPKVDSAILAIENISGGFFESIDEKKFFDLVKRGFAHKRKLLKNNLGVSEEVLRSCGIDPFARAEEIAINKWACLFQESRKSV